jgi:hypothetical protein
MEKPTVFIATPMYGGQCYGTYVQSLLQFQGLAVQLGWKTMISMMFNESLIERARNALAHNFMKSDATHLFFIDSDIRFDPAAVQRMFEVDKDIICGIYPKKEINWPIVRNAIAAGVPDNELAHHTGSFVINLVDYQGTTTVPMSDPLEVWQGGTGFMIIKRQVLEKMNEVVPAYRNDVVDLSGNMGHGEEIRQYFTCSIEPETGRLLSEDYHFCYTWRKKCGGKIYAAPWMNLSHHGTYVFEGRLLKEEGPKQQPDNPQPVEATPSHTGESS